MTGSIDPIAYLCEVWAKRPTHAYLFIDDKLQLSAVGGNAEFYHLNRLRLGEPAEPQLDFLTGLLPYEGADPLTLEMVEIGEDRVASIHLLPAPGRLCLLLIDASEARHAQQALQQRANEAELKSDALRRALEELESTRQQLLDEKSRVEEASQAKTDFLSQMSHELRTPLNAILGFSQLLLVGDESRLNQRQLEFVQEIQGAGQHLLRVINELLDLSRIEAGRIEVNLEKLPVEAMINSALNSVTPMAKAQGIRLQLGPVASKLYVNADQTRLHQVLLNLISNAIKYNRPNGTITVASEAVADGSRVRITIKDTGHGLSADEIEKVFQPFERLAHSRGNIEGTGLGLTVARQLVEAMNGTIGVDSIPGEGSTFWLEMPRLA